MGFGSVCGLGYAERTADPDDAEALATWLLGLQLARVEGRPLTADAATVDRLRATLRVGPNRPCGYAWNAAEVLGGLGDAARPAIPDLARLIRDPDLDVSAYAAEALGLITRGDASLARWLTIECARRSEESTHQYALRALAFFEVRDPTIARVLDELAAAHPPEHQTEVITLAWTRWCCSGDPAEFERATEPMREPFEIANDDTLFFVLKPSEQASDAVKQQLLPTLLYFLTHYRGEREYIDQVFLFVARYAPHLAGARPALLALLERWRGEGEDVDNLYRVLDSGPHA